MAVAFFYLSTILIWVIFLVILRFRPIRMAYIAIGIITVGYSLTFDILMGDYFGLYHYVNESVSTLYMVLSAIFLYPVANILYAMFLPYDRNLTLPYTGAWILFMLLFEYASVWAGTVVFTGWKPTPWSPLLYAATYTWIIFIYRYADKALKKSYL